jgi:hypothetical protein
MGKALKNKNHFPTLFPHGSETMNGFPHSHRPYEKTFFKLMETIKNLSSPLGELG